MSDDNVRHLPGCDVVPPTTKLDPNAVLAALSAEEDIDSVVVVVQRRDGTTTLHSDTGDIARVAFDLQQTLNNIYSGKL